MREYDLCELSNNYVNNIKEVSSNEDLISKTKETINQLSNYSKDNLKNTIEVYKGNPEPLMAIIEPIYITMEYIINNFLKKYKGIEIVSILYNKLGLKDFKIYYYTHDSYFEEEYGHCKRDDDPGIVEFPFERFEILCKEFDRQKEYQLDFDLLY